MMLRGRTSGSKFRAGRRGRRWGCRRGLQSRSLGFNARSKGDRCLQEEENRTQEPSVNERIMTAINFGPITVHPQQINGQPCIRGIRISVRRVVEADSLYPDREELFREYLEL